MLIQRRDFLIFGGLTAAFGLGGCTDADPQTGPQAVVLNISAQGRAGMNPAPDGSDRPLTLTLIQMNGTGAFDGADFFALQDPQKALGAELVQADRMVVPVGGTAAKTVSVQAGVTQIGVVAGFRSPNGKTYRTRMAVPAASGGMMITLGTGGISISTT